MADIDIVHATISISYAANGTASLHLFAADTTQNVSDTDYPVLTDSQGTPLTGLDITTLTTLMGIRFSEAATAVSRGEVYHQNLWIDPDST